MAVQPRPAWRLIKVLFLIRNWEQTPRDEDEMARVQHWLGWPRRLVPQRMTPRRRGWRRNGNKIINYFAFETGFWRKSLI